MLVTTSGSARRIVSVLVPACADAHQEARAALDELALGHDLRLDVVVEDVVLHQLFVGVEAAAGGQFRRRRIQRDGPAARRARTA